MKLYRSIDKKSTRTRTCSTSLTSESLLSSNAASLFALADILRFVDDFPNL